MRPLRLLGSLTFLLVLTACTGGQPTATPTSPPSPQVTATEGSNVKIVTDIGGTAPDVTGTPATVTPTPTEVLPTSTPLPLARLEILSQSTYKDSAGGLWVVGEAQNTGTSTATGIEVTLTLLGADGKPTAVSYATTHLSEVPPGGKTPFRGLFATPPNGAEKVQVDTRAVPVYPDTPSNLAPGIVVSDTKLSPPAGSGGAIVSGQVKDGGNETAFMIRVMAVSRDATGKVTDVADGYAQATDVVSGSQAPFSLQFPQAKDVASFEVFAQGMIGAPTPVPTQQPTKTSIPAPTQAVTPAPNSLPTQQATPAPDSVPTQQATTTPS